MDESIKKEMEGPWNKAQVCIAELDDMRRRNLLQMDKVNKIHTKLSVPRFQDGANTLKDTDAVKMLSIYTSAQQRSVVELALTNQIIAHLDECIAVTEAAQTHPQHSAKTIDTNSISTINSSARNSNESTADSKKIKAEGELRTDNIKKAKIETVELLPPGARVAVRPTGSDWILAVVVKFIIEKQKYDVEDAEDDEKMPGVKKRYLFPARSIIPIDGYTKKPELQTGASCIALYPGSSCFYQAIVATPPSKNRDPAFPGHYALKFDDDGPIAKQVASIFVLEAPKIAKR